MNPLYFAIIAAPIGVYLFIIGLVNLKRRPFVTTGSRDAAAIGIAISGLMIAGPMELFFPESAAGRFGPYVWVLLLAFYGLCVSLIVLLMRPRIVVYNLSPQSLRPLLGDVAIRLDPKARWSGDSLWLPTLDVQLNLEGSSWLSNAIRELANVGERATRASSHHAIRDRGIWSRPHRFGTRAGCDLDHLGRHRAGGRPRGLGESFAALIEEFEVSFYLGPDYFRHLDAIDRRLRRVFS